MQITTAAGLGGLPAGIVLDYAGATAPSGTLLCYGQAVSRSTYAALFTAIGTTWGAGDGSTTFNVPDLRGRATFGKDNMGGSAASRVTSGTSGVDGATLGAVGGDQRQTAHTHTLSITTSSDGAHTHAQDATTVRLGGAEGIDSPAATMAALTGGTTGSGGAHTHTVSGTSASTGAGASENMPPAAVANKLITTGGV